MLKFIGKALAGMVLTKEAQQAAGGLAQAAMKTAARKVMQSSPAAAAPAEAEPVPAQQLLARIPSQAATPAAPNRAELIRQAMQVRAAKQSLLAELDEADRAKLVATAMRAFLNESKTGE